jgi:hypothetical protein
MARPPHPATEPTDAGQRAASDALHTASRVEHAVIQPWGICVQRSLGPNGQAATGLWKAVSGSSFVPFADARLKADSDINNAGVAAGAHRVHHGLVDRLVDIERIAEINDARLDAFSGAQAVRFDATALLTAHGAAPCLAWGGWQQQGHEAIACEDVWGLLLEAGSPAEATTPATAKAARQLAKLLDAMGCSLACGNVACLIDVGSTGMWWRATQIQAATVTAPDGSAHLALALAGSPVLPNIGAWRVTHEVQGKANLKGGQATGNATDNATERATDNAPVAVIRRNAETLWQIADCRDLFAHGSSAAIDTPPRAHKHRASMPHHTHHHTHHNAHAEIPGPSNAHPARHDVAMSTGLLALHFVQPQFERLAMKSSGEYGRLTPGQDARLELGNFLSSSSATDTATAHFASQAAALHTHIHANHMPSLGIDGLHFETRWKLTAKKPSVLFDTGEQRLLWHDDPAGHTEAAVRVSAEDWQISLGPVRLELQIADHPLLSLTADHLQSGRSQTAQLTQPLWNWGQLGQLGQLGQSGRGLQAAQSIPAVPAMPATAAVHALWPDLLAALNDAGFGSGARAGAPWPIVATDKRLYLQHRVCAPRLELGWGSVQHAQIEFGGWTSLQPGPSWFGVTLGTAACPLTLVLPSGVGDAFVRMGVGGQASSHGGSQATTAQLDSLNQLIDATAHLQVQISCPVTLAFETGEGSARDVGNASAQAVIQARDDAPNQLFAQVSGMVHASVLGDLARVATAVQATAQVTPTDHQVLLNAAVDVGICLSTAALLDIDFDTEWPLDAALVRSA